MDVEIVEHNGTRYAEVIRVDVTVAQTTFYSPAESSFQFGLMAHEAGYVEPAHFHRPFTRTIDDLQQMFVVQRGIVGINLYDDDGHLLQEVILRTGDAIVLIHGTHAIRVIEDLQAISVKQGPFLGDAMDKVEVKVVP
jgi:hypothetical protein